MGLLLSLSSCDDDDDPGMNETAGASCRTAADCYPEVDHDRLAGDVICMDKVEEGYCTHYCDTDSDCCREKGECPLNLNQVCAPFENESEKRCFLSCETEDVESRADVESADEYCIRFAHLAFNCRSTGGGPQNRKVCMP